MEVPLIMAVVGVAVAVLLPVLPGWLGKLVLVFAALVWLRGLHYMLLTPGWLPGATPGPGRIVRLAVFLVLTTLICLGVAAYILNDGGQGTPVAKLTPGQPVAGPWREIHHPSRGLVDPSTPRAS